jgi:hypothetical protein
MKRATFAVLALTGCVFFPRGALSQNQPAFVVQGVVVNADGRTVAWLGEPTLTQNRPLAVRVGDRVGAYRVSAIEEDRVELEGPTGKVVVRLHAAATSSERDETVAAAKPAPEASIQPSSQRDPNQGLAERLAIKNAKMDPRLRAGPGLKAFMGQQ